LSQQNLKVIAGTLYDNLVPNDNLPNFLAKTEETCQMLSSLKQTENKHFLVIIDSVNDVRNNTAGQPDKAVRLAQPEWKDMMRHISEISTIAEKYGVRPVIHTHAGGYMEFEDETEMFLNDIPDQVTGLCLDTGHLQYACSNPSDSLKKYASRLDYVHFKDINKAVYEKAVRESMGFFDACLLGVMCSIGKGCVDYKAVKQILDQLGYRGWITIEQERDPKNWKGTLADITESRKFLASLKMKPPFLGVVVDWVTKKRANV